MTNSLEELRERIARRESEVRTFTREAISHGKAHDLFEWEADFYNWPENHRAVNRRIAAQVREMWESIAIIADKLEADKAALLKLERPSLMQRIKQVL